MHPGELARRLHARQQEQDARDCDAWLRHAQTLAFHASTTEEPLTPADVFPAMFGPGGRWPLETAVAGDERADADRAVAEMAERIRMKKQAAEAAAGSVHGG